jgi:2,3-dihydroxybiphenyl 1,2-dioxygenase
MIMPGEDLEAWSAWGPKVMALQIADSSSSTRAFRMDDHVYRLVIDQKAPLPTFGWEVADAKALDGMASRIEAAGIKVTKGSSALISQRGVRDLITFIDPGGFRVEIFYGPALANTQFQPGRAISGFRTGILGMGHVLAGVAQADFDKQSAFYQNVMGFRVSDYVAGGIGMEFMHINPRHHSFAIAGFGRPMVDHIMMEMMFFDDVGESYDVALKEYKSMISWALGRHTNDLITSFYINTPSSFRIECGWGGLLLDPEKWQAAELTVGTTIWGHGEVNENSSFGFGGPPGGGAPGGGFPGGAPQGAGGPPGGVPGAGGPPAGGPPGGGGPMGTPEVKPLRAPLQVYGANFEVGRRATSLTQVLKTEKSG